MSPADLGLASLGVGVAGAGLLATGVLGVVHPRVMLFGPGLWRGPRDRPAVALTFDDGPDAVFTPRIAGILEAHGARGTFFCIGEALERALPVARALHAAGHELANHTYRHGTGADLFRRGPLEADLQRCEVLLRGLTGRAGRYYRPAVGLRNPVVHAAARACALQVVTWTDAARDGLFAWSPRRVERLAHRAGPGSILALHDGVRSGGAALRETTVAGLPRLLTRLRERGLRPVTLSELLDPGK